jgi:dihydrofolate reductase
MRKIIVSNVVTLDGFFEGPDQELDWFVTDKEFFAYAGNLLKEVDAILFGRTTFEQMAAYWPNTTDDDPLITERMNSLQKLVISRSLSNINPSAAKWNNSTFIHNNIEEEINKLKQQPGKDIVIFGSGMLVSSLTNARLIDKYNIIVTPVILGKGNPLFKGLNKKLSLELTNTKTLGSGVVILSYKPG